jgi:heat shock protein HtpX
MAPTVTEPVLVYDRIAQNRRKTVILVIIAILMIIPFIGGISFGLAQYTVSRFGHHSISQSEEARLRTEYLRKAEPAYQREMETQWKTISKMREMRAEDDSLRWRLTLVFAAGVTGVLALLFWSLASSPTSQVLAMCGARPAGPSESEAKRLLENLSIGAGLPPPKLYVIDSPVPNAFAAGMDPSHSVVAVTHGLLALLDHRELEGVLAHELSHIGNRDTRLNTVVTSIVLFMRLPYLMRQRAIQARRMARAQGKPVGSRFRNPLRLLASPIYVYVFFIAPLLAAAVRAAISRSREFQADADAALLTRYPEGLLRALAKIRGAGSAVPGPSAVISHLYFSDPSVPSALMSLFRGNMLATHPPIEQRLNRLMEFNGGVPLSVLEAAARVGLDFARDHPAIETPGAAAATGQDELAVLTTGSPMGRVYRVLSQTLVYDQPDLKSQTVARVNAGDLLVVFDDPGKFKQVLTHDQTFGYMPASVKLQRVDMLPAEIHDPAARAAVQAAMVSASAVAQAASSGGGLTQKQIAITAVFGIALFAGIFLALLKFGGN